MRFSVRRPAIEHELTDREIEALQVAGHARLQYITNEGPHSESVLRHERALREVLEKFEHVTGVAASRRMPSGGVARGPAPPKRPCVHDSTRRDGWLDDVCLRCGLDGYWRDGQRVARVKVHPSGKPLVVIEKGDR